MKHILKSTITFAIAMVLVLNCVLVARATEQTAVELNQTVSESTVTTTENTISPLSNQFTGSLLTTTSWKTIATSTTGFNCNVYIECKNTGMINDLIVPCDICMLGKNGDVVWYESGAVPGQGSRVFWCGSDVYTIQIRTQKGYGTAYCRQYS